MVARRSRSSSQYSDGEFLTELNNIPIETVAIVDDESKSRSSLSMCVEDSPFHPCEIDGPLREIQNAHQLIASKAQGCICDHQLQSPARYADFSGAELAAWNNQHGLPSLLCTRFLGTDTQMPLIRAYLQHIPVLRKPDQLEEPEQIREAFGVCVRELSGSFTPERRSWRTQLVVEELDRKDQTISVSLPAWQVDGAIRIRMGDVPHDLLCSIGIGSRTFVRANIGAEDQELLYIDWQS